MDADIKYFHNANWATLQGSFTPQELREIADEIEKKHKDFKAEQNKTKG